MKPIQERTKGGKMGNNNEACRALQTPPNDERSLRVSRTLSTGFDPFATLLFILAASALF